MGGGLPGPISNLDLLDQQKIILKFIQDRFESGKNLQKTADKALSDAINRAKETQCWILESNKIMFYFGIFLLLTAVFVAIFTEKESYSILFGGIGFLQIVSSFFVGSMERSQKAISDLIQVEVAYLNYFEQVALWENYASTINDSNKIDKSNIEKAADKIHSCAKDTLDMLQNKIEELKPTQPS
jgi:hypothetical protein